MAKPCGCGGNRVPSDSNLLAAYEAQQAEAAAYQEAQLAARRERESEQRALKIAARAGRTALRQQRRESRHAHHFTASADTGHD